MEKIWASNLKECSLTGEHRWIDKSGYENTQMSKGHTLPGKYRQTSQNIERIRVSEGHSLSREWTHGQVRTQKGSEQVTLTS
jgi:hypothetical protein